MIFLDVLRVQIVLPLALVEVLGGVDEQHIVGLFAFFNHENAHRDPGRIEQVRRQADHRVDMTIFEQLLADGFFLAAAEQHAVGQDDRHHALIFEVVKSVQQEGEVGGALGG